MSDLKPRSLDLAVEIRRFLDQRRIEAALPRTLRKRGFDLAGYERIGGLTNRNYKLYFGEQTLVLRLPGRGTQRFIDRATERANHDAAARAGFTPASLYFDDRTGVKISHFIEDAEALDPEEARKPEMREAVAAFLARFHRSGLEFEKEFNVFRQIHAYERLARSRRARFYEGYKTLRPRVLLLEEELAAFGVRPVACHNDLVPENILVTARGLTLIDWEYSGRNDPAWDLASFLLESSYDSADEEAFLRAYCGGPAPSGLMARVEAFKCLQDFLWSLWSLLQETASAEQAKARYYRSYGEERFRRCASRLESVVRVLDREARPPATGEDL